MLSFPVHEAQVRARIAAAERAPYGKGPDTLVDTSVRDCWQIGPERIRLAGGAWAGTFAKILDAAASGLGCPGDRLDDQAVRDLFALAWRWRLTTEAETAAGAIAGQPQFATPDRTLPAALRELHGEEGLADTARSRRYGAMPRAPCSSAAQLPRKSRVTGRSPPTSTASATSATTSGPSARIPPPRPRVSRFTRISAPICTKSSPAIDSTSITRLSAGAVPTPSSAPRTGKATGGGSPSTPRMSRGCAD